MKYYIKAYYRVKALSVWFPTMLQKIKGVRREHKILQNSISLKKWCFLERRGARKKINDNSYDVYEYK